MDLGATFKGEERYFEISKQVLQPKILLTTEESYMDTFVNLHTKAFPHTYYDANTILTRFQQKEGTLYLYIEDNQLIGYSYWEINGDKEGHIEYMAVDETKRGHGYGKKLLIATLYEMFKQVEYVTLTVSGDNIVANQLYLKTGFNVRKSLRSYTLKY